MNPRPLDSRFSTRCDRHKQWFKHFIVAGGGSLLACETCLNAAGAEIEKDRLYSKVTLRIRAGFEKEPA